MVDPNPPILEFLRIHNKVTSDFGVLNIITNIFKTMQNLRFWSFCGVRKPSNFGVFAYNKITSYFGVLNIIINIFKTTQNLVSLLMVLFLLNSCLTLTVVYSPGCSRIINELSSVPFKDFGLGPIWSF